MLTLHSTLRYQTGTASFIQLAVVVLLVVLNNLFTLIDSCKSGGECAITALFSMIFIIMTALWFFVLSAIGYAAEERRSRNLAYMLILGQLATIGVAYGFFKHPANWFGMISALVVILLACWVIVLAWRLSKAKGGRIVARPAANRPRKRLYTTVDEVKPPHDSK